jgi:hypothetical protein
LLRDGYRRSTIALNNSIDSDIGTTTPWFCSIVMQEGHAKWWLDLIAKQRWEWFVEEEVVREVWEGRGFRYRESVFSGKWHHGLLGRAPGGVGMLGQRDT